MDPNHISHDGHLLGALFLAGAVLAEAARPPRVETRSLPDDVPILSSPEYRSYLAPEQTLVDFTLPSPLLRPRELQSLGWTWTTLHRREGAAGYQPEPAAAPSGLCSVRKKDPGPCGAYFGIESDVNLILGALAGDNFNKRGFHAMDDGSGNKVFRTRVSFMLGKLRLSHLKSYRGQAAAAVELLNCSAALAPPHAARSRKQPPRPSYCGARNDSHCWMVDGAWSDRVSVSWSLTIDVPLQQPPVGRDPVNCTLQMTAIFDNGAPQPRATAHPHRPRFNSTRALSFTLYSIASL